MINLLLLAKQGNHGEIAPTQIFRFCRGCAPMPALDFRYYRNSFHVTSSGRLLLCHGLGENDMQRLTPDDYGLGYKL